MEQRNVCGQAISYSAATYRTMCTLGIRNGHASHPGVETGFQCKGFILFGSCFDR